MLKQSIYLLLLISFKYFEFQTWNVFKQLWLETYLSGSSSFVSLLKQFYIGQVGGPIRSRIYRMCTKCWVVGIHGTVTYFLVLLPLLSLFLFLAVPFHFAAARGIKNKVVGDGRKPCRYLYLYLQLLALVISGKVWFQEMTVYGDCRNGIIELLGFHTWTYGLYLSRKKIINAYLDLPAHLMIPYYSNVSLFLFVTNTNGLRGTHCAV